MEDRIMNQPFSILFVDDNSSLSKTMSFVLLRMGYVAATAQDGPEAINKVRDAPFDMIIMDINMPTMNGVDAYRNIKRIRPESLVCMMTGYGFEDLVAEALQEGALGVLYKPFDVEDMLRVANETLEKRKGVAPSCLVH